MVECLSANLGTNLAALAVFGGGLVLDFTTFGGESSGGGSDLSREFSLGHGTILERSLSAGGGGSPV